MSIHRNQTIGRKRLVCWFALMAIAGFAIGACTRTVTNEAQMILPGFTEEFGEFYARPAELMTPASNDIVKSMRLNATAMKLGEDVYNKSCAQCHGADLEGVPAQHTPDLTDSIWRFSGDDLASGGRTKFPSDVEWTVRYGIRSGNDNARGLEADMVAFDPQYRSEEDKKEFGDRLFLSADEIAEVAEYLLKLSGQDADAAKAARGDALFHDGNKGNCFDCHGEDATGDLTLGSTNLTQKALYLYGSDRASILDSINHGRHGVMPPFEGKLRPEELKAVSVYVFSRAGK